ncbi:CopG family ribbon-helix-helix protein [Pelagibacterium halotolerans]|uniref:Stability determinant domain-containing protein n=1 Tax=Pelagibacterium halotolerans (strain DSM 22347 / JCM 15775 / CGMCC 1.7692 / B2) TaxID=1082931 RepID=G4RGL2_PELHB|nr:hypothetical protein [Pelagibacterium halotolerans]AEQ51071.1 hypothetical protein KKY_1036 [Pelagibacterium halotolerans B2]QJR19046.1 hypothetical protein HKM20_11710 [Pelagibacterium halotolerans]SEA03967.1 Predicted transcriptional regulator [Pelagibacterium halotolerans]
MAESTFTFRIDEDLKKQFAEIAKSKDRTGAQLVRDFIRDTIAKEQEAAEYDAWFRAKVQQGIDEADAGLGIPHEEVEAHFAKLRADLRKKQKARA